jgi:formylmethanofuran dehydrogenase subunit E
MFRKRIARSLALIGAVVGLGCGDRVVQPIAYSHKLHAGQLQIECEKCHEGVLTREVATLPALEICAECHAEPQGKTAEEAKAVKAVKDGKEIAWNRLYEVPRHVYFSHRRHTTSGKIACERCHGAMKDADSPPPAPFVALTMNDCMACHKDKGARADCVACHR